MEARQTYQYKVFSLTLLKVYKNCLYFRSRLHKRTNDIRNANGPDRVVQEYPPFTLHSDRLWQFTKRISGCYLPDVKKVLRHLESERSIINKKHSSKISGVFAIHVTVGHFENSFNHPIVILLHVLNLERCSSKNYNFWHNQRQIHHYFWLW